MYDDDGIGYARTDKDRDVHLIISPMNWTPNPYVTRSKKLSVPMNHSCWSIINRIRRTTTAKVLLPVNNNLDFGAAASQFIGDMTWKSEPELCSEKHVEYVDFNGPIYKKKQMDSKKI